MTLKLLITIRESLERSIANKNSEIDMWNRILANEDAQCHRNRLAEEEEKMANLKQALEYVDNAQIRF